MGRLRNISASLKAAAFPSANSASTTYARASPESSDRLADKKDSPTIIREASSNSIPESSSRSRPSSMVYSAPTFARAANDEIEELKPVFSFLSSHANKLYQEGYFLKLDDLDTHGKPNPNRVWTECFAQLVGTVLSFWDAEALDAAGQDGEVAPSFINLADASIKMIETLPTRNQDVQPLQNVLSVSTAGKNRYLLHFNSLHSLTQWTAGIRLAMFENASLQELYTGSLIAGKGRHLNSINQIMTKNKFRMEDWARVRFGAGTPWRRCWCVIEPPDEKEWQKSQKRMGKRSAYEKVAYPKGDIRFYDTKKIKKAMPIATITDAYSAYAIYPQSKALINESTLVKLEGKITIHSQPESKTEGFVFVMPEVHPAVSGFEMMLRWLLPVYDTFNLYGRPTRLIPDVLDPKSLMFAMPKERRYGYLDIIDIATLIHTDGSDKWTEREWRKRIKESVSRRMSMQQTGRASNLETVRDPANARQSIHFSDSATVHSSYKHNVSTDAVFESPKKTSTAPVHTSQHSRSVSENIDLSPRKSRQPEQYTPARLSQEQSPSPPAGTFPARNAERRPLRPRVNDAGYMDSANSSDSDMHGRVYAEDVERDMIQPQTVQPVATPPNFQHQPNEQPRKRPVDRPEMRREKSRMSDATLSQMNPRVLDEIRREDAARAQHMQDNHESGSTAASAAARAWNQNRQAIPALPNGTHHDMNGVGETPVLNENDGCLANTQRPAVVNHPSSSSIKRKPLPVKAASPAHEILTPGLNRTIPEMSNYSMPAQDRDSSPDYASRDSGELPKAKERVRGGTRRIVGDAATEHNSEADNILGGIDFGRTLRLDPGSRDTSTSRPSSRPGTAGGRCSPFDSLGRPASASGRRSPFDSLVPSSARKSPFTPLDSSSPARTPEKQSSGDHPSHSRSSSYAWQPGIQLNHSKDGLSAEEFVQQRAALASRPQGYVPQRAVSSSRLDKIRTDESARPSSPTSPRKLHKRQTSSRQSFGQSIDYSSHLSAREQEHIARVTGGPLLSNVNQQRTPDPNVGLVGAIGAREQERKDIKEGLQGRMVQAAIDQRQREARKSQMYQMRAGQSRQSQQLQPQGLPQQQMYYPPAYEYAAQAMQGPWSLAHQTAVQPHTQYPQNFTQYGSQQAPTHQRTPSSYSQYTGYYMPQGR